MFTGSNWEVAKDKVAPVLKYKAIKAYRGVEVKLQTF